MINEHNSMGQNEYTISALNFIDMSNQTGGLGIISKSGIQCYNINEEKKMLGACLGASILGRVGKKYKIDIKGNKVSYRGVDTVETFKGIYEYNYVLYPHRGKWNKCKISSIAEEINTPLITKTIDSAKMWKNAGIQYISYSVDVGIFMNACKDLVKKLH